VFSPGYLGATALGCRWLHEGQNLESWLSLGPHEIPIDRERLHDRTLCGIRVPRE
jgi:hypothetical protein